MALKEVGESPRAVHKNALIIDLWVMIRCVLPGASKMSADQADAQPILGATSTS